MAMRISERGRPTAGEHSRAAALRRLIERPGLDFLMEAHSGLSARIVEEAGFEGIWASGLALSASLGVRDSNETSWTQVLEALEFMSDAAHIPILVDGDTGYGNFNNLRRLVRKLEQRGIAGVCVEDKVFPKTNSFLHGTSQALADIDEFAGRIKAGKDAQHSPDFVIVARVEAFIAGLGLGEALRRAEAYRAAGADAILIHTARSFPDELLAFKAEWGDRLPVVIVPTKCYATPTDVFREAGFSVAIWANHVLRSSISAMQRTAARIFEAQTLVAVEDTVATLAEVFRLQGADELAEAERRYLPTRSLRAVILGAARGPEFGELTRERPKCMVELEGEPLLAHIARTYRAAGIRDLAVVRGHRRERIDLDGIRYFDNEEPETTHEAWSLSRAIPALEGPTIISYGDVLFRKYVVQQLADAEGDFVVMVDTAWPESRNRERFADYVRCSAPFTRATRFAEIELREVSDRLEPESIHGEWMGFLKVSARGAEVLRALLGELMADPALRARLDMGGLMNALIARGERIRVIYTTGNWLDVDSVEDLLIAGEFT